MDRLVDMILQRTSMSRGKLSPLVLTPSLRPLLCSRLPVGVAGITAALCGIAGAVVGVSRISLSRNLHIKI